MINHKLENIRNQIDKIDSSLISLLRERSLLIKEVKVIKKDDPIKIKLAREARMARRLLTQDFGLYNNYSMQKIWRELIIATLLIEGDFTYIIYEDIESLAKIKEITTFHFANTAITFLKNVDEIFNSLNNHQSVFAIFPYPEATFKTKWWLLLMDPQYHNLKINLLLPFIPNPLDAFKLNTVKAFGVSKSLIEPTQNDTSLFILSDLNVIPPDITILDRVNNYKLIQVPGFYHTTALVAQFLNIPESKLFCAGIYANPLESS